MIRKRVFEVLDKGKNGDILSILFDSMILFLIISTVCCVFFGTFTLPDSLEKAFAILETVASIVFSIEYILRLWTAPDLFPELSPKKARIKYAGSFIAIIDLITVLPFYIALFPAIPPAVISSISLLRVLRLFKLSRYSNALYVLVDVIKSRAQELSLSVFVIFVLMIISSVFMYEVESKAQPEVFNNAFSSLWWAVATFTTVGYGDIYPVTSAGRILGTTIALLGIGLVAVPTGIISSGFMELQLKNERGLRRLKNMSGHFLICGWRLDFEKILDAVLKSNPNLKPDKIVLVNEAPAEKIEALRSLPKYKGMHYIAGDFSDVEVMKKALIKDADRALIIADYSKSSSQLEIDSRTVLSVMTMKNLNSKLYVVAELTDSKFENNLQISHCDEIILTKDYECSLLATASCGLGYSNVIKSLLSSTDGSGISIEDIPQSFIGKTYGEFKETGGVLIGLLLNTGNFYQRRKDAVREAQKNPDVKTIVSNLQKVKTLKSNDPLILPDDDFIIQPNTKAIFIRGMKGENDV